MNYSDGRKVLVGDRVELWANQYGVVVCSIDDDAYSENFARDNWAYLKTGVIVKMDGGEIIHFPAEDQDLKYIG